MSRRSRGCNISEKFSAYLIASLTAAFAELLIVLPLGLSVEGFVSRHALIVAVSARIARGLQKKIQNAKTPEKPASLRQSPWTCSQRRWRVFSPRHGQQGRCGQSSANRRGHRVRAAACSPCCTRTAWRHLGTSRGCGHQSSAWLSCGNYTARGTIGNPGTSWRAFSGGDTPRISQPPQGHLRQCIASCDCSA